MRQQKYIDNEEKLWRQQLIRIASVYNFSRLVLQICERIVPFMVKT